MQAKCINDQSEEYPDFKGKLSSYKLARLTKDKLYEVEQSKEYESYFEVIDDTGLKVNYKKERFESMEDKIMVKCIDKQCTNLTFNEKYSVIKEWEEKGSKEYKPYLVYLIVDDTGNKSAEPACIFEKITPISYEEECEKLKKLLAASEDHNKIFSEENERLKLENKELQVMISNQDKSTNEMRKKFDILDSSSCQLFVENGDLIKEINQLRDELQQSNFKLKEYETKLPQIKSLVIKLVDINKILASNIYIEELED